MRFFPRRRTPEDFADEIDAHLQIEIDRLVAAGLERDDARAAALRAFGSVTRARERYYETGRWIWLEQVMQDIRYAGRTLRHSPSFAATAVLTLALGIGLVTVAFTVLNAYVLRPYAIRDPASLHKVLLVGPHESSPVFRWRDYEVIRARGDVLEGAVAEASRFLSSGGQPLAAAIVSENYFEELAPSVALGRALGPADAGSAVVVLGDAAWRRLLQADPSAPGRVIDIGGRPFRVVGVLGPEFGGIGDPPQDLWMPAATFAAHFNPVLIAPDGPQVVEVYGRLLAGVTPAQAGAALTPLVQEASAGREQVRAELLPQSSPNAFSLELAAVLAPVFAAFGLVLVTACANVSNIMLARAIGRQREIAVRLSLGASRPRIVRQLLTEGVVIAGAAGAAGLVLAWWTLRAGVSLVFSTLPASVAGLVRLAPTPFDHRVFVFAFGAATLATLLFAPLPSLQGSRLPLTDALRGHATGTGRGSRLRSALVAAQVAVSLVLVVVALTLWRTASRMGAIDPGYDTRGVLSINVRGEEGERIRALVRVLQSDARITGIAVTNGNPLFVRERDVPAGPAGQAQVSSTRYTFVSPEYFSLLRIPIVRGRPFSGDEARAGAPVAVVSAATASAFWPDEDPIGKQVHLEDREHRRDESALPVEPTVVGVVPDVVSGLVMDGRDRGHIYLPADAGRPQARAVLVRGRGEREPSPASLQDVFRRAAADADVFEALPLDEMRALQIYPLQAASAVGSCLAAIAIVLSVSGLYGVLSYILSGRRREIGIRMALGATASAVARLVLLQSIRLAAAGIAAGALIAVSAMYVLNAAVRLPTASLLDPAALLSALALVLVSVAVAAWPPARRAARVDPAQSLRAEG